MSKPSIIFYHKKKMTKTLIKPLKTLASFRPKASKTKKHYKLGWVHPIAITQFL